MGTQLFIRTLSSLRDLEVFISVGNLSHRFGPIEDAISMRYISVHGRLRLHFGLIPQIIGYISKFKNTFHQLWDYPSFNFKYLSH